MLGARAVEWSEFLALEGGEPGAAETAAVGDPVPSVCVAGRWMGGLAATCAALRGSAECALRTSGPCLMKMSVCVL